MTTKTSYSWSEMLTFMSCQRRHELAYHENLERIPSAANKARLYGTAFHASMAVNLLNSEKTLDERKIAARKAARKTIEAETPPQKTVKTSDGRTVVDQEYYNMINEITDAMPYITDFAIEQIDLTRYQVATVGDLFGLDSHLVSCDVCHGSGEGWRVNPHNEQKYPSTCSHCDGTGMSNQKFHAPVVEWEFDLPPFKGIVDAVLFDTWNNEYVIVDWKLRYMFPNDDAAAIDGQLAFYAAVLNSHGAQIRKSIMWQFRRNTPQPAKMNQDGKPSIAAQNTTFEIWWDTLPSPVKNKLSRDNERVKMADKLKPMSHFVNAVEAPITERSSQMAWDNAHAVVRAIREAKRQFDANEPAPALLGGQSCQWCDFKRLCAIPLKYGGDARTIIALEYRPRNAEISLEIDEV